MVYLRRIMKGIVMKLVDFVGVKRQSVKPPAITVVWCGSAYLAIGVGRAGEQPRADLVHVPYPPFGQDDK
jgi:hypothetical protein